jgi:hypothetical protein
MIMRRRLLFAAGAIALALASGGCTGTYGPPYGETLSYGYPYGPWGGFYSGYWGPGFVGGPFFVGNGHFHDFHSHFAHPFGHPHFAFAHAHFGGSHPAAFAFHGRGAFAGHGMMHASGGTPVGFGGPHAVAHRG